MFTIHIVQALVQVLMYKYILVWASLSSILQAHTTTRNVHLFSSCYSIRHHVLMTLTSTTLMLLLLLQNDEKQSCRKVVIKSCFSSKGMTS